MKSHEIEIVTPLGVLFDLMMFSWVTLTGRERGTVGVLP